MKKNKGKKLKNLMEKHATHNARGSNRESSSSPRAEPTGATPSAATPRGDINEDIFTNSNTNLKESSLGPTPMSNL